MDTSDDGAFRSRRYTRRPKQFPRRNIFPRRRNVGRIALREVNKIKRDLKKGIELKDVTGDINLTLVAGTAQSTALVYTVTQGTTGITRIGDDILVNSIAFKGALKLADNETKGAYVRIMLVYDRRPNGAQATIGEVLHAGTPLALYNIDNEYRGRFQMLYDQIFNLNIEGQAQGLFKGFIKRKMHVLYNGNAGTIADLQKGNIFFLVISSGNDQNLAMTGYVRLRYTDN